MYAFYCTLIDTRSAKVLRILQGAGSFPDGAYARFIADRAVLRSLNRIANNAYPGFRPATTMTGEARQSSPNSAKRTAETSLATQPGGSGGVGKVGGRDRVSAAIAFNLLKPRSPESRQISELATEVAYLVGTHASKSSPRTPSSPLRRKEVSVPPKQPHSPHDADHRAENERDHGFPTESTIATESESVREGGDKAPGKEAIPFASKGRVDSGAVSGRPGTYLGCGVSSCKGLGFDGEHGDVAGNTPHAAFVLRKAGKGDEEDADSSDRVARDSDNGDKSCNGLSVKEASGEIRHPAATGESEPNLSIAGSPDVVVATPLALLSARDECFRLELVRRKEHYGLGGTKAGNTKGDDESRERPLHAPVTREQDAREHISSSAAVERDGPFETPRRSRSSTKMGGNSLATAVDVAQSPLMATTRPTGRHPRSVSRRGTARDGSDHLYREPTAQPIRRCTGAPSGSQCASPGGKEFVTFARPAAHWSVTKSLGAKSGRARIKGIRVPGALDESSAGVVGRFACRGYLLDPTFVDHNPVILHPRLPHIGGGGGGISQVAEGVAAGALGASRDGDGGLEDIQPYRNVVEVLGHNVEVLGDRQAAKQRYFDEQARTLQPPKIQ